MGDVVVYYAYLKAHQEHNDHAMLALSRAAWLLSANRTHGVDQVKICRINADQNDVPPPWGHLIDKPVVVLYPMGQKEVPRYMNGDEDGLISTYDVLHFIMGAGHNNKAREWIVHLLYYGAGGLMSQEELFADAETIAEVSIAPRPKHGNRDTERARKRLDLASKKR